MSVPASLSPQFVSLTQKGFTLLSGIGRSDLFETCRLFGEVQEYQGNWCYDVRPEPELLHSYTAKSLTGLNPHLDKYELDDPPDLVGLYCVNPDRYGHGRTLICDMRPFLETLSEDVTSHLATRLFEFEADEGLQQQGYQYKTRRPILDYVDARVPRLRFSYNYTKIEADDLITPAFLEAAKSYFYENKREFLLQPGELLIFRNTWVLHAREPFRDAERHLQRVYINEKRQ